MKIINGTELSKKIKADLKIKIENLIEKHQRAPHLTLILVGNDANSASLVKMKEKACQTVGITSEIITLEETISESELLNIIDRLNQDSNVDGILIQLPLPEHLNTNKAIEHIALEKDVDAFHPVNIAHLNT